MIGTHFGLRRRSSKKSGRLSSTRWMDHGGSVTRAVITWISSFVSCFDFQNYIYLLIMNVGINFIVISEPLILMCVTV